MMILSEQCKKITTFRCFNV